MQKDLLTQFNTNDHHDKTSQHTWNKREFLQIDEGHLLENCSQHHT